MESPLKIESRMEGGNVGVLSLAGEIDIATKDRVREAAEGLIAEGARNLLVDLAGVEYMDSSGLGVLKGLRSHLVESGGQVGIVSPRTFIKKLFERAGLDQVFPMYEELGAALEEVGK